MPRPAVQLGVLHGQLPRENTAVVQGCVPFVEVAGADKFEQGLRTQNRDDMRDGLQLEEAASHLLLGAPGAADLIGNTDDIAFNIAEAQLALGQTSAATRSYEKAVALARRQMHASGAQAQGYLGSALTDLTDLAEYAPGLHETIRHEDALIVDGIYGTRASSDPVPITGAAVPKLSVTILPTVAEFRLANVDSLPGRVNAQWYYKPTDGDSWSAFTAAPSGSLAVYRAPGNAYVGASSFSPWGLPNPGCLPSGYYMLDLYAGGNLVARTQRYVSVTKTEPEQVSDMGLSLCRPRSWSAHAQVPGLVSGYMRPHGHAGLLVFDVSSQFYTLIPYPKLLDRLLDDVLREVGAALPPYRLTRMRTLSYPFLGQSQNRPAEYAYAGGRLVAGITVDPFGSRVVVVVAFGPTRLFSTETDHVPAAENLLGSAVFN